MLGAAQHEGRRRAVLREVVDAARRDGPYRGSVEELLPLRGDARSLLLLAAAGAATTLSPRLWSAFAGGAVERYALSAPGWRAIRAATDSQ
jgi:hypothetical protein